LCRTTGIHPGSARLASPNSRADHPRAPRAEDKSGPSTVIGLGERRPIQGVTRGDEEGRGQSAHFAPALLVGGALALATNEAHPVDYPSIPERRRQAAPRPGADGVLALVPAGTWLLSGSVESPSQLAAFAEGVSNLLIDGTHPERASRKVGWYVEWTGQIPHLFCTYYWDPGESRYAQRRRV